MRRLVPILLLVLLGAFAGAVIAATPGAGHEGAAVEGGVDRFLSLPEVGFVLAALFVLAVWWATRLNRLPVRGPDSLTMPPEWLLGLLAAMLLAQVTSLQLLVWIDTNAAGAVEALRRGEQSDVDLPTQVFMNSAAAGGQLLVGFVYLVLLWLLAGRQRGAPDPQPRRWSRPSACALGAVLLIPVFPLLATVNIMVTRAIEAAGAARPETIGHQTLQTIVQSDQTLWQFAMICVVVLAVPIVEELLYRGIVQELLSRLRIGRRQFGHWPAILVTSLVFTSMHLSAADWNVLPALFVLSIALGWVYARSGRLLAPIALHAAFNGFNVAMGMLMSNAAA